MESGTPSAIGDWALPEQRQAECLRLRVTRYDVVSATEICHKLTLRLKRCDRNLYHSISVEYRTCNVSRGFTQFGKFPVMRSFEGVFPIMLQMSQDVFLCTSLSVS